MKTNLVHFTFQLLEHIIAFVDCGLELLVSVFVHHQLSKSKGSR